MEDGWVVSYASRCSTVVMLSGASGASSMPMMESTLLLSFFLTTRPPPRSTHRYTLFPYTTLFRSVSHRYLSDRLPGSEIRRDRRRRHGGDRSEEHTSELQSHSGISYAVFCLKK